MHDLSHAESLIEIAEIDLTALREMSDKRFFASRVVGCHAQQAIEKLLKCWLVILRLEYPLTHSIGQLLQLIRNQDTEASQFEDLQEFTPYAVLFRYEKITTKTPNLDRDTAIARIDDLMHIVRKRLDAARRMSESQQTQTT